MDFDAKSFDKKIRYLYQLISLIAESKFLKPFIGA